MEGPLADELRRFAHLSRRVRGGLSEVVAQAGDIATRDAVAELSVRLAAGDIDAVTTTFAAAIERGALPDVVSTWPPRTCGPGCGSRSNGVVSPLSGEDQPVHEARFSRPCVVQEVNAAVWRSSVEPRTREARMAWGGVPEGKLLMNRLRDRVQRDWTEARPCPCGPTDDEDQRAVERGNWPIEQRVARASAEGQVAVEGLVRPIFESSTGSSNPQTGEAGNCASTVASSSARPLAVRGGGRRASMIGITAHSSDGWLNVVRWIGGRWWFSRAEAERLVGVGRCSTPVLPAP